MTPTYLVQWMYALIIVSPACIYALGESPRGSHNRSNYAVKREERKKQKKKKKNTKKKRSNR